MFYTNYTQIQLNKELTRILNVFKEDQNSGYTLLTMKEEKTLIIRVQELERKLQTTIVIPNIYNDTLGE
jgi:hypothetical protein